MKKINKCAILSLIGLLVSIQVQSATESFDIGTPNWTGTFPGAGTYDQTIGVIHVTGIGERIFDVATDQTAVFSGNDNPVQDRNYTYTFPPGATVSIDFTHLTRFTQAGKSLNNIKGIPKESVGNFSVPPTSAILGSGHTFVGNAQLLGNDPATDETVSTLTWVNITNLSFDIAANGTPSFVAHKNMVVTVAGGNIVSVPSLSTWSVIFLALSLFGFTFLYKKIKQE